MKYKITTFLLLGITIILCFTYFRQKQEISNLNAQITTVVGKTDTVYINKPFKLEPSFQLTQLPRYVFIYGKNSKDNTQDNNQVHNGDSIVQVILGQKDLSLSFFKGVDSSYYKVDYKINLDDFRYNWVNGELTYEKVKYKLKFIPYVYTKYRPIHSMVDLGIGLNLKTQRFQYKLGINGYYYPGLKNKIGIDPEISITYNLSK
jgi:hypothetical protein